LPRLAVLSVLSAASLPCPDLNLRGCTRLADLLPSKYEDNTLQIKEKSTERTTPFFVLEVTARSAADILGIHPNSAALFYRKIRMVISHHLALVADEVFEGSVELDESYFGGRRKGKRGRVRQEKWWSSAS